MNLSRDLVENLKRITREVCEREGCILYDLEFVESRPRILRVYIDRLTPQPVSEVTVEGSEATPGTGASVDDCANVSRGLNLLLDVEDVIPGGAYELEVSTPGLERKLTEVWHFEAVVGRTVKVNVSESLAIPPDYKGKGTDFRSIQGVLKLVSDNELRIEKDGVEWSVPTADITKANLVFVMEQKSKGPQKGPKNKKR